MYRTLCLIFMHIYTSRCFPGTPYLVEYDDMMTYDDPRFHLQWLCIPFVLNSPATLDITVTAFNNTFQEPWLGTLDHVKMWKWIDDFLMIVSWIFKIIILSLLHLCTQGSSYMSVEQTKPPWWCFIQIKDDLKKKTSYLIGTGVLFLLPWGSRDSYSVLTYLLSKVTDL